MLDKFVLIVDDQPEFQQLVRFALDQFVGVRTVPAADGEAAIAAIQVQRPTLVLCDLVMPKLDGFAVCRRLKADPATRTIPLIAMTYLEQEPAILAAGFDGYVHKGPDLFRQLAHRVRPYVESSAVG